MTCNGKKIKKHVWGKYIVFWMHKIRNKFRERRRLKSEIGRFHEIEARTVEIFASREFSSTENQDGFITHARALFLG